MAIGAWWGIPLHYGCRCTQKAIKPGGEAPNAFVDFRDILDGMPHDQQVAAIGASNYKLLKTGVIEWKDVVTPGRVRDLREVVANKRLSVKTMTDAGVRPTIAEAAHKAVHTAEHELVAQRRRELAEKITAAGLNQEQLSAAIAKGVVEKVSLGAGPDTYGAGPAWPGGKPFFGPGTGPSHAAALTAILAAPRPRRTGEVGPAERTVGAPRVADDGTITIRTNERTITIRPGESAMGRTYEEWSRTSTIAQPAAPPPPKPLEPPKPPQPPKPPAPPPPGAAGLSVPIKEPRKPREKKEKVFTQHDLGKSKAKVTYEPRTKQEVERIFGRKLTNRQIASLAGAPDDAKVRVSSYGHGQMTLNVQHPQIESMTRTVRRNASGKVIIHNDIFKVKPEFQQSAGKIGLKCFAREAQNAHELGVSHIETYAFRVKGDINPDTGKERWSGYYVWPRYGYEGPIPQRLKGAHSWHHDLPPELRGATNISELMAHPAGREWWRENGDAFDVEFDLTKGSYSMTTLNKYLQETIPKKVK